MSPPRQRPGLLSRATLMAAAAALSFSLVPRAKAANLYWDSDQTAAGNSVSTGSGLGGEGTWDASSLQWFDLNSPGSDLAWNNAGLDVAYFIGPAPSLGSSYAVNLASSISVGGLNFGTTGYVLSSATSQVLTLAGEAPSVRVGQGVSATIEAKVSGTNGFTLSGGGVLRLGNTGNDYTGITRITNGSLVISGAGALGAGTSAISILANNQVPQSTQIEGIVGGQLVLDGSAAGFELARDINFEGRGLIGDRSAAILSIGDNTLSGTLTSAVSPLLPATFRNSRINSINGTLTLSGSLVSQGTTGTTFVALGGISAAGVGNFNLTGVLSGSGSVEKSGAGTLFLNPSSVSGFTGTLRVAGSATGQQSSVRVTEASVGGVSIFGSNTGTNASAAIDMNGGVLELRSAGDLNFNSLSTGKNVYLRANSTFYTGPAAGGSTINGLATFGTFRIAANTTGTFESRNGYGMTFQAWTQESSNNQSTITNNMGGTLTFTGNAWNNDDASARTLNLRGTGTTVVTGSIDISGAGIKSLSKKGTGTWEIRGTSTDIQGDVAIDNGALVITDFRSINNNTATIQIGSNDSNSGLNSTNNNGAGALIIGTSSASSAAGLTTSKVINLQGTTNGATIYANQALASPVILNGNFTATGINLKTLTLGGLNTQDNIINGNIVNNATGQTQTSANYSSGATTITLASVLGIVVGDSISGTGIPSGTTVTAINTGTRVVTLSAATTAGITATTTITTANVQNATSVTKVGAGTWVLAGAANTYTGATTIQAGTLKLRATAGASDVVKDGAVTFSEDSVTRTAGGTLEFLGFLSTDTTETVGALTPTAGLANIVTAAQGNATTLTFASLGTRGAGATVNYDPGASTTIAFTTAPVVTNGIIAAASGGAAFQTFNEVDWAALSGNNVVQYAGYTTTSIPTSGTTNANTNYSQSASASTSGTASINTLKIVGGATPPTITLGGVLTLTAKGVLFDNSAGSATITGSTLGAAAVETVIITAGSTPGNALTVSSLIGSTTGSLTKSGSGTLIVSGNNTFTGNVHINQGTLRLSGSTATLGVNSTAGNITSLRQDTTLDINAAGASQTIGIGALQGAGTITNSGGAASTAGTISFGRATSTGTTTFSGILQDGSGVLNVTIDGTTARTQALLGLSTYTGVTTIATGAQVTVNVLANGGAASGIGASTNAAANLVFNGTAPTLIYQGNNLVGSLNLGSNSATTDRLFTIAGAGAVLSSTASNNNAIVWSNTGAIALGTAAAKTLTLTGASTGDNTFNPQLTDSGTGANITSLTKTAAGQWNLGNSNNTYTGQTRVQEGILALNQAGALPANSPLVLGNAATNGTLQTSGTFARDLVVAASITPGIGTITFGGATGGGGFAAHTTPLTVTLSSNAALTWGEGGFVPSGGQLLLGSATALSDVKFTNPINFGGTKRTINVVDNGNTGADYATLSGVLSGDAGIGYQKTGNTVLRTTGANTYTGVTDINAGALVVTSLGLGGSGAATSSVGAAGAGVTMTDANAVTIGNASTSNAILQYVGPGETSDRKIRINATTGSGAGAQIHADGTGPLILTNVANDMVSDAASKNLWLRGSSPYVNQVTSLLANNGGALNVNIDGGTAWVLTNSANSYTGTTTVSGGALGIGHDTAIPGALSHTGGNIFAHGADRTLGAAVTYTLGNNATVGFIGDYGLTFTGTNALGAAANNITLVNSVAAGKSVTFNGLTANALTAGRSWTVNGPGETVINGNFTTSTSFWVRIDKTGDGTLVLGTSGAGSDWNTKGGSVSAVDLDRGTLRFSANEAIPSVAGAGGLLIAPDLVEFDTATVDLNGTTQTINSLTATTDGTVRINNSSANAAVFRFGANNATVSFGTGLGSYSVLNTGAGKLDLVKLGNTSVTFNSGVSVGNKGMLASEGGGSFTIAGPVTAASGLRSIGASTLSLSGGIADAALMTSIEVGGGSTLSLLDGAGSQMVNLSSLKLGSTGTGTVVLNLNVGEGATDTMTLKAGGELSLGNTVTFNLTDAGLIEGTTYTLLNLADGGLTAFGAAKMIQGATPGGFSSMVWSVTDGLVQLTTGSLIVGDVYWRGLTDAKWNGNANNWSKDKAGATPADSIPGAGNKVIFAYDNVGAGALTTTLEQNIKINALVFEPGASTPASVTINPGAVSTSRLEVAPSSGSDGIRISAGGPTSVTISGPVRLGGAAAFQTWSVVESGSSLTLGTLLGERDVTKAGAGKVVLSSAADPTFNAGQTADFTISAGNLEIANVGALGTAANGNLVVIVVNGGGFYHNSATAGTVPNAVTLGGGALSGGGADHTYSGPISVSAASIINLADSNGAATAAARSITLSGPLTGTAALTVDGNSGASNGNQLGGTLFISNGSSNWSGDLVFNRGTVSVEAAASAAVLPDDITFSAFGRYIVKGVDGRTIERSGALTLSASAVGEFQVDNTTGTQVTDFVVNQNGAVALGAGSALRVALPDQLARFNLTGSVTLGGAASLSVSNNAARIFTVSGVIAESVAGAALAINDDQGGWGQTNGVVRLTGANTFSGNVSLGEGILEFTTVTNIGGGASSLGNGSAISLAGGNLRFIGSVSQSTDRPISTSASSTLSANGTDGASVTYAGRMTQTANNSLNLAGTDASAQGRITGGVTQSGTSADLNVASGSWTLSGAASVLADDIVVTGASAVLNLNGAGLISFTTGTSNGLYARTGATINLLSSDVFGAANSGSLDFILLGDNSAGVGTLNVNSFWVETPRLDLGQRTVGYEGQIDGTGTVFVKGGFIDLFRGTVNANLGSDGSSALEKYSLGSVTLKGDNSGLASSGSTVIYAGALILDYSSNNAAKLRAASALDMRGGSLGLNGNAGAATAQSVAGLTLANGGANVISLNPAGGQNVLLSLGAVTRAVNAQAGTLRIGLPAGAQGASHGVTTSTALTGGVVGGAGYITVDDGTGVWFASKSGDNIVALPSVTKNDVTTWNAGEHVTDAGTGYVGVVASAYPGSIRFNAAAGSDVALTPSGVIGVATGGILVTDGVGGTPSLMNGTLFSGAHASNVAELIVTQDSASVFEIGADLRVSLSLTKSGAGTLRLSGNSNYTGSTEVQNGTLQLSGGSAVGDSSLVTLSASRNSTLQLLSDETIGRLQGGARLADQDLGMVDVGSRTLTINQSANATYSGRFTGSGAVLMNAGSTGNLNYNGQTSTGLFTGSVIVNGGLFQLSGDTARLGSAAAFTINGSGNLLLDNDADSNVTDRIGDAASFTLNSAAGSWGGQTVVRGLAMRNNDNDDAAEVIGAAIFNSGTSYLSLEASGGTSAQSRIVSSGWTRNNAATLNVRGRNLGASSDAAGRSQFKVQDANDASMLAANVGGAGTIGGTAKNVSIVPWAVGESVSAAMADTNMGNTFLSYVDNRGLVPLSLSNEYATFSAATSAENVRQSLSADLTGLSGKTVNSLVLHHAGTASGTYAVTGSGAGQALTVTSGGFLFTRETATASTAYVLQLSGFDNGIAVGSANEYVFHVINPDSASVSKTLTASIGSKLTSAADITKSGRGALILGGASTAGGGARKTTVNEGVLEISDLDNIGGATGELIFAGGALRLGAGLTDDLSQRTIVFLQGGGTIDTNGIDLVLASSVGSGVGGLTKTGAGNLTLNAGATYAGPTIISSGTLTVGAANATGSGGNLTVGAGATLALGVNSVTAGVVTLTGANPVITGTGTIVASGGFFINTSSAVTIGAVLAGPGGLFKNTNQEITLTGLSTYAGTTEVQDGILTFNSIANVGGGASALGAPATASEGVIRLGRGNASVSDLRYVGTGHSSDRLIGIQGTSGTGVGAEIFADGTGALGLGGVRMENAGDKTLVLRGTSAPSLVNTMGAIQQRGGALTLNKTDANTWRLSQASNHTGATQIDSGTLQIGVNDALPAATAVRIGTGATAGTFDLNGFNQTVGSLSVQTSSNAVTNELVVDAGNALTVTGAVTIGVNANESDTNLSATGGGSLIVNSANANFQVGAATGNDNENRVDADLSGLASFTADLGTGVFRLGDGNTGTGSSLSTLRLAPTSRITAASIRIGDGTGGSQVHVLTLGSGVNTLNANTLNIGSAGSGVRSSGRVSFDASDVTGSLVLRAADGVGRATVNMVNTSGNTAANIESFLELSGHAADILASTLTLAARSTGNGAASAFLSFDQGSLDVSTMLVASRTGAGTGDANATVTLGDGAAAGIPTVSLGALNLAVNTSAGGAVTADFNVTGGNIAIGTGGGTAISMANAVTGRAATSTLNITGGTVSVAGAVVRAGGGGTENATVLLDGGTLDLNGFAFGETSRTLSLDARSGTLRNAGTLNGTGGLTKSGAGTLTLQGATAFTGATTVTAGSLVAVAGALASTSALDITGGTLSAVDFGAAPAITVGVSGTAVFSGTGLTAGAVVVENVTEDALHFTGATGVVTLDSLGGAGKARFASGLTLGALTGGTVTVGGAATVTTLTSGTLNANGATASVTTLNGGDIALGTTALTVSSGTYGGVISGATGTLTKSGAGTLILSGANTFGGAITISAGKLQIGAGSTTGSVGSGAIANSGTLEISRSDALTFANVISGTGAFIKSGAGNLTLSGANDFTGATTVSAGELTVDSGALAGTSGVTVNGAILTAVNLNATAGLTLDASGTASFSGSSITLGAVSNANTADDALLFNAGSGTVTLTSLGGSGKTRFASNASIGTLSAGTVTVDGSAISVTTLNGGVISLGSADLTASAGSFGGSIAGTGGLTKSGAGTLTLSAASTYSGATTVSAGVLAVSHASGLGASTGSTSVTSGAELRFLGGITIASEAVTLNGAGISSAGALRNLSGDNALAGAVTLASASRINSDAGTLTLSGGVSAADFGLTLGGAGLITINTTGLSLGAGTLTKDGAGTLLISASGVYSGLTTVSAGTLKVGHAGALGSGNVSVAEGATLDLNGFSISNVITLASGATLTGGTLSPAAVPTTGVLDVVLTGNVPLQKTDAGTLVLTAANDFTGPTSVSAGTIAVADFGNGTDASPLGITDLTDPNKLVLAGAGGAIPLLEFTGATGATTARSFTVGGDGGGIAAGSGAGALVFTEAAKIKLSDPDAVFKLVADNAAENRFAATLAAGSPALKNITIDGTGKWVMAGPANRFAGDFRLDVAGGTLKFESGSLGLGAGFIGSTIEVSNGATLAWADGNVDDISSRIVIPDGATAKLQLDGATPVVFSSAPTVGAGGTLEKTGSGTLTFASGVSATNLEVSLSSGRLVVNGTVGSVTVGSGSVLSGGGTVTTVDVGTNGTLAPGNSPGLLTSTSISLGAGAIYSFEVADALGAAGTGYDSFLTGTLDLSGAGTAAGQKITLKVISMDGTFVPGTIPANFSTEHIRSFTFGNYSQILLPEGVTNINDIFAVDVSQFVYSENTASAAGLWSLSYGDGTVTLTAVPEPSTYGFAMGALALAAAAVRRRRKQARSSV